MLRGRNFVFSMWVAETQVLGPSSAPIRARTQVGTQLWNTDILSGGLPHSATKLATEGPAISQRVNYRHHGNSHEPVRLPIPSSVCVWPMAIKVPSTDLCRPVSPIHLQACMLLCGLRRCCHLHRSSNSSGFCRAHLTQVQVFPLLCYPAVSQECQLPEAG